MRFRPIIPATALLTGTARTLVAKPRYVMAGGAVLSLTAVAVVALAVGASPPPMPPGPVQARAPALPTAVMPMSVAPVLRPDQDLARPAHPASVAALRPDSLPSVEQQGMPPESSRQRPRETATVSPHAPASQTAKAETAPRPTANTRPMARPATRIAQAPDLGGASTVTASLRPQTRPAQLASRVASRNDAPRDVAASAPARAQPKPQPQQAQPQQVAASAAPALRLGARGDGCARKLSRAMPRRGFGAGDGSAVMAQLTGLDGTRRDQVVMNEVLSGNMPGFLHDLTPVTFNGRMADGTAAKVTICVTPDYLALGSDRDFVRVPLGLRAATRIAERFDMLLPTARMVDAIYSNAQLRLPPRPMDPGPQMTSTDYLLRHNATIESQRGSAGAPTGTLISGHKKDLVLTNRITQRQGRVAIYGWHRPSGTPIQPLSTVHGAAYADYSHGIRLVSKTAYVNGRAVDLREMLADQRYASLVSKEGPIAGPHLLMASLARN